MLKKCIIARDGTDIRPFSIPGQYEVKYVSGQTLIITLFFMTECCNVEKLRIYSTNRYVHIEEKAVKKRH